MEIINLKCNNCGADLKVKPHIKFFNCTFCNSSLAIKKTENTMYTEVLGKIKTNTENLLSNSKTILIEKEIARLDREWIIEKESYKINNKYGSELPNKSTGITTIAGTLFGLIFMIFWLSKVFSFKNSPGGIPTFFVFFGIVMIIILIVNAFSSISKSEDYHNAKEEYLQKRNSLLKGLNKKN